MGSLQAHEERVNRTSEKEEKAFQAKEDNSSDRSSKATGRGRGRRGFRGKERGRSSGQSSQSNAKETQAAKGPIKCYYCTRPGHKEVNCWKKEKDQAEQKGDHKANFAEQEEKLFLTREGSLWTNAN
ncbi:hypothetical protein RND81_05G114000 [Saponaria officinalis]|uniref:CCHC-type domain-containing protein n=1 Tax=Saponaria officinalis TaxID=3572 RepID=A0AAW1KXE6_SAPOF